LFRIFPYNLEQRRPDRCPYNSRYNMFENKNDPLAPRHVFITRVVFSFLTSLLVVAVSLGIGTWGYHVFGELGWIDSLLNASMILAGMGPVDPLTSVSGKLFATFYCLFSGIIFLTLMAIILAPIYHRFLHNFHFADGDDASDT
jgi:hypothetical protein